MLLVCISFPILQARDPFSFADDSIKHSEQKPKESCQKASYENKDSYQVGDRFNDEWIVKGVSKDQLILQNDKGQIFQVSKPKR